MLILDSYTVLLLARSPRVLARAFCSTCRERESVLIVCIAIKCLFRRGGARGARCGVRTGALEIKARPYGTLADGLYILLMAAGTAPSKISLSQHDVERTNLLNMAKLAIKGLLESSMKTGRTLDDSHGPLRQFFVVLEHVMRHGLKGKSRETQQRF